MSDIAKARAEWSDIRADPDTTIRREKWAVWANTTGVQLMGALETLQAENERLRESESNLVKQINGYKDVLAQAEGIIYELREEKQIDQSPRTRWG